MKTKNKSMRAPMPDNNLNKREKTRPKIELKNKR